ncbi:tyrosine--tRNA ligase [Patescibacteria group bacterium]|nr:tyrosine--tRNA ligase [Patescibacteria group bacterium]MBU1448429.1 tyrosine--tRNA ligase [Patescibacteria group bacterium]MBU2612865.1 tyrosine--tRNA ligase [Patescibacteria group bacterium]
MAKKSTVSTDQKAIRMFLTRGVENVYPTPEALEKRLKGGKPLTAYLGIDPTGPSLHIGHAISMRKLAELQKLGHKAVLLIGDFTARIGDPTDKFATRKKLTREQVLLNCKGYRKQASKILDFDGSNPVEMRFNSDWLDAMTFSDVVELASHFTVQQMAERDMFETRMKEGKPVYLHEFLYPLMQGYDSVAMDVDLEIGGNDQTFNMLAGRTLMKEVKGKEKFVLANRLLTDPTGRKMGKTEGNMITLVDAPEDMFGKVMSWTDGMIIPGFELCTDVPMKEIQGIEASIAGGENPVAYKRRLAAEVVTMFIGEAAAEKAAEHFTKVHTAHEAPEEMPTLKVGARSSSLLEVLVQADLVASKSEARRQIMQGGVKVDGKVVKDVEATVKSPAVVQKGKRFFVRLI